MTTNNAKPDEPKNAREYYRQESPTGPEWESLDRKTRRLWSRSYRDAYPKPLFRNFKTFLADVGAVITIITKLFPRR